jgi:uncharacterized protein YjbJ (UPF0337 family)
MPVAQVPPLSSPGIRCISLLNPVRSHAFRDWLSHEEASMNWDQIEGKWKQYSGKIKEKWGKLTDDDLTTIKGRRDQLVGVVQERYGMAKDQAEKQVDEFTRSLGDVDVPDAKKARGAGH